MQESTRNTPFYDNDGLSALLATELNADLLILLTDVNGLYTGDPGNPDSRYHKVYHTAALCQPSCLYARLEHAKRLSNISLHCPQKAADACLTAQLTSSCTCWQPFFACKLCIPASLCAPCKSMPLIQHMQGWRHNLSQGAYSFMSSYACAGSYTHTALRRTMTPFNWRKAMVGRCRG